MSTAATLRAEIEASLAHRIPSALTPVQRIIRPVVATGIQTLDKVWRAAFPSERSRRLLVRSVRVELRWYFHFLRASHETAKVCAWVDVSDVLHPESAAASGVDLETDVVGTMRRHNSKNIARQISKDTFVLPGKYLVPSPIMKGLHGGGFGPHPRGEGKGLPDALHNFFQKRDKAVGTCRFTGKARYSKIHACVSSGRRLAKASGTG